MEWIMKYWVEVLFGLLTGGAGLLFRSLFSKIADYNARQDAVEKGVQALLRNSIVQSYNHYVERGSISLHGLESVERMYTEYHNLGGNGTVTKLVEDLREFPVMDKPPTRI